MVELMVFIQQRSQLKSYHELRLLSAFLVNSRRLSNLLRVLGEPVVHRHPVVTGGQCWTCLSLLEKGSGREPSVLSPVQACLDPSDNNGYGCPQRHWKKTTKTNTTTTQTQQHWQFCYNNKKQKNIINTHKQTTKTQTKKQ